MERAINDFLAALGHDKSGSDTKLALAAVKKRVAAKREDLERCADKVLDRQSEPVDPRQK